MNEGLTFLHPVAEERDCPRYKDWYSQTGVWGWTQNALLGTDAIGTKSYHDTHMYL